MEKIKMVETDKGFWVVIETDTQYLSLTGNAMAPKSDSGAEYVGRRYKTARSAKIAAKYYEKLIG